MKHLFTLFILCHLISHSNAQEITYTFQPTEAFILVTTEFPKSFVEEEFQTTDINQVQEDFFAYLNQNLYIENYYGDNETLESYHIQDVEDSILQVEMVISGQSIGAITNKIFFDKHPNLINSNVLVTPNGDMKFSTQSNRERISLSQISTVHEKKEKESWDIWLVLSSLLLLFLVARIWKIQKRKARGENEITSVIP